MRVQQQEFPISMSKKKAISRKQRRIKERKRLQAGKPADLRTIEGTEDDAPEPDVEPTTTCVADVRKLREKVLEQKRGHRAELRSNLAEAYRYAQDLKGGSIKPLRAFLREPFFDGRKLASPKKEHKNVFTLVCEYVFDAKTRAARKINFKRAAVLAYLNEMKIDPDNVPETIISFGGIEKVYALSAAHKKAKLPKEDIATASTASDPVAENYRTSDTSDNKKWGQDEDQEYNDGVVAKVEKNTAKSQVSEKFVMNRKLRERLHDISDGQEVTLICVRLGENDQGRTRFKVRTLKVAKAPKG